MLKCTTIVLALSLVGSAGGTAIAQTIGYAEAIDQLAISCRLDIDKFCKTESLGGGRVRQCLLRNQSSVSARCTGSINALGTLLEKRAAARASVVRVCDLDIKRRCSGVEPGDGNLLSCFFKTKQNISAACQQAVADAGYEAGLAPASAPGGQIKLSSAELVNSLQGIEATASRISGGAVAATRQSISHRPTPHQSRKPPTAS